MNKVSKAARVKSEVTFEVTVPGLARADIPMLDMSNSVHIIGCTNCSAYGYKFESSKKRNSLNRASAVFSSFQYVMFIMYTASNYYAHDVWMSFDEKREILSFKLDFGTEYEDHAERFYNNLFLCCKAT